jgi:NTP pyrophosphatase (non-canonical NTP hydrolase)
VKPKVVVSGSFNKFLAEVRKTVRVLRKNGFEVLAPRSLHKVGSKKDFVLLAQDRGSPGQIERNHLQAILASDVLYVVNPGGYIGHSVAMEIGYATCAGVPVYSNHIPEEHIFSFFVRHEPSIRNLRARLRSETTSRAWTANLPLLQGHVRAIAQEHGFDKESPRDGALLLMEEVGELAKAIRNHIGLKVGHKEALRRRSISDELADCMIYLLHIANITGTAMEIALREKEAKNARKKWTVGPHRQRRPSPKSVKKSRMS